MNEPHEQMMNDILNAKAMLEIDKEKRIKEMAKNLSALRGVKFIGHPVIGDNELVVLVSEAVEKEIKSLNK